MGEGKQVNKIIVFKQMNSGKALLKTTYIQNAQEIHMYKESKTTHLLDFVIHWTIYKRQGGRERSSKSLNI